MDPDVSVVVASFSGEAVLRHCLESLEPQAAGAEVIVATDVEASGISRLEARYPGFRFVRAPRGTSVFRLRALGIDQASGRLVALTEDLPERGLYRGQVGTVMESLAPGVFEVEFSDDEGRAYASLALAASQLLVLHYEPVEAD